MNVLVTGGAGYIGSLLVPMLLDRGDAVRIVDCGWFGVDHVDPRAELIVEDVLNFEADWLDGVDAIVHLAGLSNDPMAAFSPALNYMANAAGLAVVAQAARDAGIARFVFASSCSVYGLDDAEELTEDRPVRPPFPYGISKLMGESMLACLASDGFRPIILRKGTVVGWSPRMRFDLVTNTMVKTAITTGRIIVHSPSLWRPLIDVQDAARAYLRALDADRAVSGIFNIAAGNYTVGQLAAAVAEALAELGFKPDVELTTRRDVRSYRVCCAKAAGVLGFRAAIPIRATILAVASHILGDELGDLEQARYYNIMQMKRLVASRVIPWVGAPATPAAAVATLRA